MQTFTAIDFETATGYPNSACAVGIVTVVEGKIVDEYYTLIQPPGNLYWWQNILVHKIKPEHTESVLQFDGIYSELKLRMEGNIIVAHNEVFDRNVLKKTMLYYGIDYADLNISDRWECTCKIYRAKGFKPASLNACCYKMDIELNHHEALSDARACAMLYLKQ